MRIGSSVVDTVVASCAAFNRATGNLDMGYCSGDDLDQAFETGISTLAGLTLRCRELYVRGTHELRAVDWVSSRAHAVLCLV